MGSLFCGKQGATLDLRMEYFNFIKRNILFGVIFITGGAILIIETVATRVLAPHFGNTIFTFSSVIGVILAALSFGYYVGGRVADRWPSAGLFYALIIGGGVATLVMRVLIDTVVPTISQQFSLIWGPLILSVLLFLVPSFLLAMLSPFVITLQKHRLQDEGVGQVSGKVFFWSTFGSIAGVLLSGFYLIPRFGITHIITTVGSFLLGIGFLGFFVNTLLGSASVRRLVAVVMLLLIVVSGTVAYTQQAEVSDSVLYRDDGMYQRITVREKNNLRLLQLDGRVSGGTMVDSDASAFDYTEYYKLYKMVRGTPQKVFVAGGGVYAIPRSLSRELPRTEVHVSEIEPSLDELAKKYFGLDDTARIITHETDARRWLKDTSQDFDFIFEDVYGALYAVPSHLITKEFFMLIRNRLSNGGIFVANVIGQPSNITPPSLLYSAVKTFRSIFPNSYFFVEDARGVHKNVLLVAVKGESIPLLSRLKESEDSFLRKLPQKAMSVEEETLKNHRIFTDNYAPVDFYVSRSYTK